jgi:NADH dehydrogenase
MPEPKVVVIGAGFGGLSAVQALRHAAASITLIDRENHHTFQPLLYQAATAALSSSDIAWPVRSLVRKQRNVRVVMAEVTGVDVPRRCVRTDTGTFDYHYLVLATGSTHSYFGHDEWSAFAPGLKRIADAETIRQRILLAFERAELTTDPAERSRLLPSSSLAVAPPAWRWPARSRRSPAIRCVTISGRSIRPPRAWC